jgi:hypothetical protein
MLEGKACRLARVTETTRRAQVGCHVSRQAHVKNNTCVTPKAYVYRDAISLIRHTDVNLPIVVDVPQHFHCSTMTKLQCT